jgi:sugar/nucleoside kinase (ribokinase family)
MCHAVGTDRPDVIVVGDIMADVTVAAGALARGGDVQGDVRIRPGGGGANAAVWAAATGTRVRLLGRVGRDLLGDLLLATLRQRRVDASVARDPGARTGAMLVVTEGGDRSMVADRGANARWSTEDLPDRLEADAVLVSGYLLFDPGCEAAALAALDRAEAPFVAVDASSWPLLEVYGSSRFMEATGRANILFANSDEFDALLRAVDDWWELPWEHLAIKRGPAGGEYLNTRTRRGVGQDVEHAGPVVDTTGAGDAFDGAFLAALVRGSAFNEALGRAVSAGLRAAMSIDTWPEA